ncbi:patatin-like phospholipase family protein [Labilibacter marinus]|uniref:patatin-like phospholipase family protein n=1 Tax=Labilibacter marinus TaxID=1477105 RepID=UPI00094F7FE4|nr:patatin-like phospholipase family protein [Labilibacter marinus]
MLKTFTIVIVLSLVVMSGFAQELLPEEERPKIGLVLSGGGAKGIAHIGVLKILEQLNIRPDYITGTSMGSIMGGLYAIGYSADELDSIVRIMDWGSILVDKIPLTNVIPEEKHGYNRFLLEFDLTKSGPKLPASMVKGQGIMEQMNYLAWHVSEVESFDDFPIPFRCVASDLISGKPYVFDSGDLVTAMRASMAIPSVFSPVSIDTMLLVDGGVLDNMPVVTCREMGADIIITVNVGFREKPSKDDFKTLGDVLMGAAMIRSNYEADKSLRKTDILISPDLQDYGAASFFDGPAIIELGEEAARERFDELASLADFLSLYPQKEIERPELIKEIFVEKIKIGPLKYLDEKFVLGKSGLEEGKSYTKDEINGALHQLIGTMYIKNIDYNLKMGERGYILTLLPTETYRSRYNFSINYDDTYKVGAVFNFTLRNRIVKGSNLTLKLNISEFPIVSGEFIDYRGEKQLVGNYIRSRWEANSIPYFTDDGDELGRFKQSYLTAETGLLFAPNTKRIIRTGIFYRRKVNTSGKGLLDLVSDDVDRVGQYNWGLRLNYNKNSLNEQFYPTRGNLFDFDIEYPFGFQTVYQGSAEGIDNFADLVDVPNSNYIKLNAKFKHVLPSKTNFNFSYMLSLGGATADLGSMQHFEIGGLTTTARLDDIPFPGMMPKEIFAKEFAMAIANFRYKIGTSLYAQISTGAIDYSSNYPSFNFLPTTEYLNEDVVFGANAMLSYDSIIGPLKFGYGRSTLHRESRWFFAAGFPF